MWDEQAEQLWQRFIFKENITENQSKLFRQYIDLLLEWNRKINLTRIVKLSEFIAQHLQDSLKITQFINCAGKTIVDIGSGGGFPGIPLKIMHPDVRVILLEVNQKKRAFLQHVIDALNLEDISISPFDWRTFLRQNPEPVDFFMARASLKPLELMRMFKSGCAYNKSTLIYWASHLWVMRPSERPFFRKEENYTVGGIQRRYVFFECSQELNK